MLGRPARSNLPCRGLWRIVDDRIIAVDRAWDGPTTVLAPSEDVLTLTVDLPFPTRPTYNGNPWFVPWIARWWRFRDRFDP